MENFKEDFRKFYQSKGLSNDAELARLSELTPDYISKLINNPIFQPSYEKIEAMAKAFAKKAEKLNNQKFIDGEEKDIYNFFEQAKIKYLTKSENKSSIIWKITLEIEAKTRLELLKYIEELEKKSKGKIKFKGMEEGSVILWLESSPEVFEKINLLYQTGELTHLLDAKIINIQAQSKNLSQWFQGIFTQGWQTVEELLNPQQLIPATWNEPIKRAKLISELPQPVVLVITLRERNTSPDVNIGLQIYPHNQPTLPLNFTLQMLVEDRVLSQAIATSNSPYLECRFNCDYEDKFTIKLIDSGVEITESFIV
jgi:transcriptional regulator with XRE-family HTH domain